MILPKMKTFTNEVAETEMYFDHIDVLTSIMSSQLAESKEGRVLHMYDWSKFPQHRHESRYG